VYILESENILLFASVAEINLLFLLYFLIVIYTSMSEINKEQIINTGEQINADVVEIPAITPELLRMVYRAQNSTRKPYFHGYNKRYYEANRDSLLVKSRARQSNKREEINRKRREYYQKQKAEKEEQTTHNTL
jgi:hypothetical protein